jgi:uncharacterized Tic20 family protein
VIVILASIFVLTVLAPAGSDSQVLNALLQPGMVVFFIVLLGLFALYFVLPIIAAVACALGRDFRYPILGDRLARYLAYRPAPASEGPAWLNEDREFRWVAAMGHFSILILLWGMLAPLTASILQGRQNFFLKFQSIQTLVYQAIATLIFLIGGFFYLFGLILLVAGMGGMGSSDLNSSLGIVSLVVFGLSLLISAVFILLVPLLHILGQWAGYRVLKGEDYRYPLVGRWVERRMANTRLAEGNGPSLEGRGS